MSEGVVIHVEPVRFRDVDAMGHVNNAVFLTYLEQARIAFFEQQGLSVGLDDLNLVVARVEIDFRAPVRLGQEIEVAVRATRFGTKSFDVEYELTVDGEIVAEAKSVLVAYDYGRGEPVAIPAEWREKLSGVPA